MFCQTRIHIHDLSHASQPIKLLGGRACRNLWDSITSPVSI